jgi:hypothetical protein
MLKNTAPATSPATVATMEAWVAYQATVAALPSFGTLLATTDAERRDQWEDGMIDLADLAPFIFQPGHVWDAFCADALAMLPGDLCALLIRPAGDFLAAMDYMGQVINTCHPLDR